MEKKTKAVKSQKNTKRSASFSLLEDVISIFHNFFYKKIKAYFYAFILILILRLMRHLRVFLLIL